MKKTPTVLLIDHTPDAQNILQLLSDQLKFQLIHIDDGEEGLDFATKNQCDLILIRKDTPSLDAQSFSVLLRQIPLKQMTPIIVLCKKNAEQNLDKFKDAGCNDCMTDPSDIIEASAILKKWLYF